MADAEVIIEVGVEDNEVEKKLENLEDAAEESADSFEELGNSAKEAESGLDAAGVAMGSLVADGISSLTSALGDAVSSFLSLADETREYREDMAKLQTAFTDAGSSTETATRTYKDFYKILGESDRSVEAVNHLAELTTNEKELSQWGTIAAGVTAKFGDSLPIEGLTEAANETAKVGAVTGPLADALNWAGISEDEFNKKLAACNSEQERASLITSTLNGEYAAAAEEYNKLTGSAQEARLATANMEEAQASIGAALEPVTTAWTNMKAQAFEAMVPVIETLVGWLGQIQQWAAENPTLMSIITGALTGVAVALGVLATAAGIYTAVQWAMNSALLASPITWIVVAIGALIGVFVALWNNCEGFRNFFIAMWEGLQAAFQAFVDFISPAIDGIKNAFVAAWNGIKAVWDAVLPFFQWIWDGISAVFSVVTKVLGGFFSSAWNSIKSVWDAVSGFFTGIWDGIKNGAQAAWDGITSIFSGVASFFGNIFGSAWEAVKNVFSVGGKIFDGIKDGILNAFKAVVNTIIRGINTVVALPFNGLNGILNTLQGIDILGLKPFGWLSWRSPVPQIPYLAKGGVVRGATTAVIGEDGAEAVVPLERNTQWLDEIAKRLSKKLSSAASGVLSNVRATVSLENSRFGSRTMPRDTSIADLAQAVGMQTAGINSMTSTYKGASSKRPIVLQLDKRELGRAVVDVGGIESQRVGLSVTSGGYAK